MVNKPLLRKVLLVYTYLMLVAACVFFVRGVSSHYSQMHGEAPPPPAGAAAHDRGVSPLIGWNESTLVLPFLLLYSFAAFALTTSPFPRKSAKQQKPGADRYIRRTIGAACVVVAALLFLIITFSFFVQERLEGQMFAGEDAYRREHEADEVAEPAYSLEAQGAEDAGEEAAAPVEEEGQCMEGAEMSQLQIVLSSLDTVADVFSKMLFGNGEEDDDNNDDAFGGKYKKAKAAPAPNSYFYNFAMIQRAEVLLLHLCGFFFGLFCLFTFDDSDGEAPVRVPREQEPQEKRHNPGLTADALKQLGAGAQVPRAKKTAALLQGDDGEGKKKQ